jgi:hypothetical protein
MVVIVLTVVSIASDTLRVYDRAVADLSSQSEARGVLDAMENDFSTASLRSDGRCWMEVIILGGAGAPASAPAAVGNIHKVDQPIIMLFSAPLDRPRWNADASSRRQVRGDVCAVAYRIGHRSPFDMPGEKIQQIYGVYRTVIDSENTFKEALPIASFDRAITVPPEDFPDRRGALAADFKRYLALRHLKRQVKDLVFGYGPLEDLLALPTVTEIMVVDSDRIYVETGGRLENSGRRFLSDEVPEAIIDRIVSLAGRSIDRSRPMVDARLADGSRVNAVIPPIATHGISTVSCQMVRTSGSGRWTVSLVSVGKKAPKAT